MAEARARAAMRTTVDLNILMRSDHRTEKLGCVYLFKEWSIIREGE